MYETWLLSSMEGECNTSSDYVYMKYVAISTEGYLPPICNETPILKYVYIIDFHICPAK